MKLSMSETTYYKYISNGDHYTDVIAKLSKVEHHLWIGTADIKELYVKSGSTTIPFLKVISQLIERGVEVRLIHAKEPGPNFYVRGYTSRCSLWIWRRSM